MPIKLVWQLKQTGLVRIVVPSRLFKTPVCESLIRSYFKNQHRVTFLSSHHNHHKPLKPVPYHLGWLRLSCQSEGFKKKRFRFVSKPLNYDWAVLLAVPTSFRSLSGFICCLHLVLLLSSLWDSCVSMFVLGFLIPDCFFWMFLGFLFL